MKLDFARCKDLLIGIELAVLELRKELEQAEAHSSRGRCTDVSEPQSPLSGTRAPGIVAHNSLLNPGLTKNSGCKILGGPEEAALLAVERLKDAGALSVHCTLVAALTGFAPADKRFELALERLQSEGLLEVVSKTASLSDQGRALVPSTRRMLTTEELVDKITVQLPSQQRLLFRFLYDRNGSAVDRAELAKASGSEKNEKALYKDLSALESLGLVSKVSVNRYSCADIVFLT